MYTPPKSCFGNPLPLSLKVPALGLSLLRRGCVRSNRSPPVDCPRADV